MSKIGRGRPADPDDGMFGEDILREIDEMLRDEPAASPRKGAVPPSSSQPPARAVPGPPPVLKGDPENRRKARQLAIQAQNAQDPAKAQRLAREALALDRACVEAWVVLARAKATAPDELAEHLETAIRRGEHGLGLTYMEHYRGSLWSREEARPYMRARRELADVFRDMGQIEKAVEHYEALLELDAGDSLRVREPLLGCYLAAGYLEWAGRLLDRFTGDGGAVVAWSRVLQRYLAGDLAGATTALGRARKVNPAAEDYLLGRKPMPLYTLGTFSRGGEYEGQHVAAHLLLVLARHPRFAVWLNAQSPGPSS